MAVLATSRQPLHARHIHPTTLPSPALPQVYCVDGLEHSRYHHAVRSLLVRVGCATADAQRLAMRLGGTGYQHVRRLGHSCTFGSCSGSSWPLYALAHGQGTHTCLLPLLPAGAHWLNLGVGVSDHESGAAVPGVHVSCRLSVGPDVCLAYLQLQC